VALSNFTGRLVAAVLAVSCWPGVAAAQVSVFADGNADARIAGAIADYDRVAAAGGWPQVPLGPALKRGVSDERVVALRARLAATGDLPSAQRAGRQYDRLVARAVRRFQARHGLWADGIVGRLTLAAMNVSAADRRAALALNRTRLATWQRHIAGVGIVVNIPDATMELLEGGRRVLRSHVVVGQPGWPTPVLHSAVFALDVNPKWYVPPRIAERELLPRARQDPDYLRRLNIRVFAAEDGSAPWTREVPYEQIDFSPTGRLRYRLRQDAGPRNALGAVKFVFDNPYSVFLHDTPDRRFFARSDRSLSHGCVRVAAALDFARHFAAREPGLGVAGLEAAIASGETKHLTLSRPVPIHLVYLTAWVDRRGRVQFRQDIYRRDRPGGGADPALAACGSGPKTPAPSG